MDKKIEPFAILKYDKNSYSVTLIQDDYYYDWVLEMKYNHPYFGDGNCYEDAFRDYLKDNFSELSDRLDFDSENGMFCVYCTSLKDAKKVASELSAIYNNEEKMVELIRHIKEKYNYVFHMPI